MRNPESTVDYSVPGFRIESFAKPAPWSLVVRCDQEKEWGVVPESLDEQVGSLERAVTTILYRGRPYRIHQKERQGAGWVHRMKPWPESESNWVHVIQLSSHAVVHDAVEQGIQDKEVTMTQASILYDFLIGWLPGRVLENLSESWLFGPEDAALRNAWLECAIGIGLSAVAAIVLIVGGMGGGGGGSFSFPLLALYICFEGYIRYGHIKGTDKPLGSFPFELVDWLYVRMRDRNKR